MVYPHYYWLLTVETFFFMRGSYSVIFKDYSCLKDDLGLRKLWFSVSMEETMTQPEQLDNILVNNNGEIFFKFKVQIFLDFYQ